MLRALTYNIHGWRGVDGAFNLERLARIIVDAHADVVSLNEVHHPFEVPAEHRPALEVLAERLGMNFVFAAAVPAGPFADPVSGYGNALLSVHPILAHAGHRLSTPPRHEPRGLLEARLLLPGRRTLTVYVTHLDHKDEAVRLGQVQALLLWSGRDRKRSHLLLGDLNALAPEDYEGRDEALAALAASASSAHMVAAGMQVLPRLVKAGYVDCFATAGQGPPLTYATTGEMVRIDYCLAAGPLATTITSSCRLDDDEVRQASDHFPLLSEFDF